MKEVKRFIGIVKVYIPTGQSSSHYIPSITWVSHTMSSFAWRQQSKQYRLTDRWQAFIDTTHMVVLVKRSGHIEKSGCRGVVAIPCHAPAEDNCEWYWIQTSTQTSILYVYSQLYLSVVLICRALLSILAPMSSMLFPLRSTFLRQVLLPKALTSTVPLERRRESIRDRVCRAWTGSGETQGNRMRGKGTEVHWGHVVYRDVLVDNMT